MQIDKRIWEVIIMEDAQILRKTLEYIDISIEVIEECCNSCNFSTAWRQGYEVALENLRNKINKLQGE